MPVGQIWQEKPNLYNAGIEEFPTEADRNRIATYTENRQLREDEQHEVFERAQRLLDSLGSLAKQKWACITYLQPNLLAYYAEQNANGLFLDPPAISLPNDKTKAAVDSDAQVDKSAAPEDVINDIIEDSQLFSKAREAVDDATVDGDWALKVYGEPAIIDTVDMSLVFAGEDYFPEYAALNRDNRKVMFPFIATPMVHDKQTYVVLEIHEPGQVVYRAYEWHPEGNKDVPSFIDKGYLGNEVDVKMLMPEVEDYPVKDDSPTLHVNKFARTRRGNRRYGRAGFNVANKGLQDQVNALFSLLDRHSDDLVRNGHLIVPMSVLAMSKNLNTRSGTGSTDFGRQQTGSGAISAIEGSELDIIGELPDERGMTRVVGSESRFDGLFRSISAVIRMFEKLTRCTLDNLEGNDTAPESGRAMRYKRIRDYDRIADLRITFTEPLRKVLQQCAKLRGVPIERPVIGWSDPFPLDAKEKAEIADIRTGGKQTQTVADSIIFQDNLSPEEAEEKANAIQEASKVAMADMGIGKPPTFGNGDDDPKENADDGQDS